MQIQPTTSVVTTPYVSADFAALAAKEHTWLK